MPVIFDWTCGDCGHRDEYFTMRHDIPPVKCTKCGSETAEFTKHLVGPKWIEGTTPGSKPPSGAKHKVKTMNDLYK